MGHVLGHTYQAMGTLNGIACLFNCRGSHWFLTSASSHRGEFVGAEHLPGACSLTSFRRQAGGLGINPAKPKLGQIEPPDKDINHANRIILANPIFAQISPYRIRIRLAETTAKTTAVNGLDLRIRPTRAVVMSNAVLLDCIVRNLVRNAIKYTPDSGRVLLACRRRGVDMRIDIYDTGIGMSADQLPRIFEALQRLDSTRADGLGLGLFVVRRAVELLGHRIEVSSTVRRGSRFSVLAKAAMRDEPIATTMNKKWTSWM
jgi:hypothetical protein